MEANYYFQSPSLGAEQYDWRTYVTGKQITQAPYGPAGSPDVSGESIKIPAFMEKKPWFMPIAAL